MDREDQRRYLVVASVILEVVTPLFQQKIENDFTAGGFGCLQAFINSQHVIHALFHLRHRNSRCCKDKTNCYSPSALPLVYCQWKKLYSENPGPGIHNCHCKFTANPVQLTEMDISLSSLILLNCCSLSQPEEEAVDLLRQYKNGYLSHNTTGCITQTEYNTLWPDLVTYVLRLDPSKHDNLVRIENRPLDESLCKKYFTFLLDLSQQIAENNSTMENVHSSIQAVSSSLSEVHTTIQGMNAKVHSMDTTVQGMRNSIQGIETLVQKTNDLLQNLCQNGFTCECGRQIIIPLYNDQPRKKGTQYRLGQGIFYLHQKLNIQSLFKIDNIEMIIDVKMMDDGRLVFCLQDENRILICNTNGSQTDSISLQKEPWYVTAVNTSIVAVTVASGGSEGKRIEMFDINSKHKLKSISVPEMSMFCGITMMNNKLVVGGVDRLLIVDHQTGETIQKIETGGLPGRIHASSDRIFFSDLFKVKNNISLNCFNDNKVYNMALPSIPTSIISLPDGRLYVFCKDGSIHHVSNDFEHMKKVKINNIAELNVKSIVSYNTKQNKMVVFNKNSLRIFHQYQ